MSHEITKPTTPGATETEVIQYYTKRFIWEYFVTELVWHHAKKKIEHW